MTVKITGSYLGNKKVELLHGLNNSTIMTDAPKDNSGDGSLFSPTDLLAASLGTCMLTVMSIFAESNKIDMSGTKFELEKHMLPSPRRVGSIPVKIHLPASISKINREKLEKIALTCPVSKSLHPDIDIDLKFIYDI
ncbi:MAG: OsmC family protein [bacterium]|nr:OsmC family protein [bacterium]